LDSTPVWFGLGPARELNLPAGLQLWYHGFMAKQTVIPKKRGPAPTGKGTPIMVRLQPFQLAALDAWIAKQDAPLTRPEAIRAMMETILHIQSKDPGEKPAGAGAERAKELAAKAIDKMTDAAASADDQASRKRRLLKGPEEFREARVDRLKAKTK
jgi:hypothetical protein